MDLMLLLGALALVPLLADLRALDRWLNLGVAELNSAAE